MNRPHLRHGAAASSEDESEHGEAASQPGVDQPTCGDGFLHRASAKHIEHEFIGAPVAARKSAHRVDVNYGAPPIHLFPKRVKPGVIQRQGMDCLWKTNARKAKLVQTSGRLFNGKIRVAEWNPSPCLKPTRVSSHQFCITVVDASCVQC